MEPAPPPAPPSTAPQPPPATPTVRVRRGRRVVARVLEALLVIAAVGALGLWCSVPDVGPLAAENPTSTAFIDLRVEQAAQRSDAGFALKQTWRPLGSISRYLRAAVIYAEDYNFYRHGGVDWRAIEHAATSDWRSGKLAIGGSTITQQLAKNLYLSPSRSLLRKAREILIAGALEDRLSKQRILELYLNVVEWGNGIFGAEAAAQHWFHHSAQSLSPAEAIRLAIALPNPFRRAPDVRSAMLTRKGVRIAHLLRMQGLIDPQQERATLDALGAHSEKTLPSRLDPAQLPDVKDEPDDEDDAAATPPTGATPPMGTTPATAPTGATGTTPPAGAPPANDSPPPNQPAPTEPAPNEPAPTEPTPSVPAPSAPSSPPSEAPAPAEP